MYRSLAFLRLGAGRASTGADVFQGSPWCTAVGTREASVEVPEALVCVKDSEKFSADENRTALFNLASFQTSNSGIPLVWVVSPGERLASWSPTSPTILSQHSSCGSATGLLEDFGPIPFLLEPQFLGISDGRVTFRL